MWLATVRLTDMAEIVLLRSGRGPALAPALASSMGLPYDCRASPRRRQCAVPVGAGGRRIGVPPGARLGVIRVGTVRAGEMPGSFRTTRGAGTGFPACPSMGVRVFTLGPDAPAAFPSLPSAASPQQ
jgi:hypothetical protein